MKYTRYLILGEHELIPICTPISLGNYIPLISLNEPHHQGPPWGGQGIPKLPADDPAAFRFSPDSDKNDRIFCLKTYNRYGVDMMEFQPRSLISKLFGEKNEWKVDGSVYQWKRKKF